MNSNCFNLVKLYFVSTESPITDTTKSIEPTQSSLNPRSSIMEYGEVASIVYGSGYSVLFFAASIWCALKIIDRRKAKKETPDEQTPDKEAGIFFAECLSINYTQIRIEMTKE